MFAAPTLFLGSFPPRECGIATFTADVVRAYDAETASSSAILAIDERPEVVRAYPTAVCGRIVRSERRSYVTAAQFVDRSAVELVHVEHEYGLFGGQDGSWFLDFLQAVHKPVVVTLHTVLPHPSSSLREVTVAIARASARTIVLSETAKKLLVEAYAIHPNRIAFVPHGVPDVPFGGTEAAKHLLGIDGRTTIATFGLIGRGKGLEHAIDAMRAVVRADPSALYLILGQTHPGVRAHEGESYRAELQARVDAAGLHPNVRFVDRYLAYDELVAWLRATDIYVTPYINPDQVVSGTLAYAFGCGKAVVSTPYLYARELIGTDRGTLVPFADAAALGEALARYATDRDLRDAHARAAYTLGRTMSWARVGRGYAEISRESLRRALHPHHAARHAGIARTA